MQIIHIALNVSGNAEIKNVSSHHVEKLCHFFNKKNTSFAPINVNKKLLDNKNLCFLFLKIIFLLRCQNWSVVIAQSVKNPWNNGR